MATIDSSNQEALGADSKSLQQINVTRNIYGNGNANTAVLFIIVKAKESVLDFLYGAVRAL